MTEASRHVLIVEDDVSLRVGAAPGPPVVDRLIERLPDLGSHVVGPTRNKG
jgi:hypothetical protein